MNTGSNFLGLVYDQRGFPREINSSIDIGAVEFAIADPPTNASIIINNGALTTIYFGSMDFLGGISFLCTTYTPFGMMVFCSRSRRAPRLLGLRTVTIRS